MLRLRPPELESRGEWTWAPACWEASAGGLTCLFRAGHHTTSDCQRWGQFESFLQGQRVNAERAVFVLKTLHPWLVLYQRKSELFFLLPQIPHGTCNWGRRGRDSVRGCHSDQPKMCSWAYEPPLLRPARSPGWRMLCKTGGGMESHQWWLNELGEEPRKYSALWDLGKWCTLQDLIGHRHLWSFPDPLLTVFMT